MTKPKIKSAGKVVLWGNRKVGVWSPKKDFFIYRFNAEFERSKYDPTVELVRITVEPWPTPAKPKKRRKQIVYGPVKKMGK